MLDEILRISNKYSAGQQNVAERRNAWLEKHKEVREHLKEIAIYLNEHSEYKSGYFVDTNHAFNEEINGTCASLPSITFRSGPMPLHITFRNAGGATKDYVEEGFHMTFTPTVTGEILVLLLPHYTNLNAEKPGFGEIAVIESPESITSDIIDKIVARGLEAAFFTSYTGVIEQQRMAHSEEQKKYEHSPIGFKRFESTEKVK